MFRGILIEKHESGYSAALKEMEDEFLPDGDVTVRIAYSTLNYKDGLAITGGSPVVRRFPMIPGIDLAGTVEVSNNPALKVGDLVLLNGWGVGEIHWGGLAQKARLKKDWLIPVPAAFTLQQAMAIGTAGFTAMLSVMVLERYGIAPERGEILVTGAAGGVGSIAIALLSKLGYQVAAMTGRVEETDYLKHLGAAQVLDREEFAEPGKPLGKERWAAAIDVAGGQILANICATTKYAGVVCACGLAGGMEFPATVAPFILRGITLAGIDSVMCPRSSRFEAWLRLARDLDASKLESITRVVGLSEAIPLSHTLLEGKVRGRIVVDVQQ